VSVAPEILSHLFDRVAALASKLRAVPQADLGLLTPRELEVLTLVTEGQSNKEIARTLSIQLQTVKNYVHTILHKLTVRNRREAARYMRTLVQQ
jgi:DNA-binding NarL/FixJ family response regulator